MRVAHLKFAGLSAVVALAVAIVGCQFPADADGTLDRVTGGTLRVGVSPSAPFVTLPNDDEPEGVEPELVRRFAASIDAEITWVRGSESELMEALAGRQLDIVIAGLTRRSEWSKVITLTRPYYTYQWVIAAPDRELAEELSDDLEGHEVAVEANSAIAAKLDSDTDARMRPVDDVTTVDGPVAIEEFLLDDLNLVRTDAELDEHEQAMAVANGENAFLVALEKFLLDSEAEAAALVDEVSKP